MRHASFNNRFLAIILLVCTSSLCNEQQPNDSKPDSTIVRGAEYSGIHGDLSATFRIKAPEAKKVELQHDKRYWMVKGADSFWTVTTTPQVPGFHYYTIMLACS
jgi:hypothetical protein